MTFAAVHKEEKMNDLISRKRALEGMAFSDGINVDGILYVPLKDVNKHLQNLPSVQPKQVIPHKKYKNNFLTYWCECGCYLGKKGEMNYCPDCGGKVNWNGRTD